MTTYSKKQWLQLPSKFPVCVFISTNRKTPPPKKRLHWKHCFYKGKLNVKIYCCCHEVSTVHCQSLLLS